MTAAPMAGLPGHAVNDVGACAPWCEACRAQRLAQQMDALRFITDLREKRQRWEATAPHRARVEPAYRGAWWAVCACGWRGDTMVGESGRALAGFAAELHASGALL